MYSTLCTSTSVTYVLCILNNSQIGSLGWQIFIHKLLHKISVLINHIIQRDRVKMHVPGLKIVVLSISSIASCWPTKKVNLDEWMYDYTDYTSWKITKWSFHGTEVVGDDSSRQPNLGGNHEPQTPQTFVFPAFPFLDYHLLLRIGCMSCPIPQLELHKFLPCFVGFPELCSLITQCPVVDFKPMCKLICGDPSGHIIQHR